MKMVRARLNPTRPLAFDRYIDTVLTRQGGTTDTTIAEWLPGGVPVWFAGNVPFFNYDHVNPNLNWTMQLNPVGIVTFGGNIQVTSFAPSRDHSEHPMRIFGECLQLINGYVYHFPDGQPQVRTRPSILIVPESYDDFTENVVIETRTHTLPKVFDASDKFGFLRYPFVIRDLIARYYTLLVGKYRATLYVTIDIGSDVYDLGDPIRVNGREYIITKIRRGEALTDIEAIGEI
jgi:hypothetical protein